MGAEFHFILRFLPNRLYASGQIPDRINPYKF
jgi:hypothetical protein